MQADQLHEYALGLVWEGHRGAGTADYSSYERRFRVTIAGKAELFGSADPRFRGDSRLHNPEDLLLAAVSSCHMLTYLALCARSGITVVRYSDAARGKLAIRASGGGSFQEIMLQPCVTVAAGTDLVAANALHDRAHELCFIANSCRFPIHHKAEIHVE
jgi:organic hydroperoxide reductase OsmC/OhrA